MRIILEIEEADITPVQLCGKFLVSAISSYLIHEKLGDPLEMADSVLFVQIVDTSKLKQDKTSKVEQCAWIEKSIQNVLPIRGSKIRDYRLFRVDGRDFTPSSEKSRALIACIQSFLA